MDLEHCIGYNRLQNHRYIYRYGFTGAQVSCDWCRSGHVTPKIDSYIYRYIYKFGAFSNIVFKLRVGFY